MVGLERAKHSWGPWPPSHYGEASLTFLTVLFPSCYLGMFSHRLKNMPGLEDEGMWFTVGMKKLKRKRERESFNPEAKKPKARI